MSVVNFAHFLLYNGPRWINKSKSLFKTCCA